MAATRPPMTAGPMLRARNPVRMTSESSAAAGWVAGAGLTACFFPFGCWARRMAGVRRQETASADTRGIMRISEEGVAAESVKGEQYTGRELRIVPEPRS